MRMWWESENKAQTCLNSSVFKMELGTLVWFIEGNRAVVRKKVLTYINFTWWSTCSFWFLADRPWYSLFYAWNGLACTVTKKIKKLNKTLMSSFIIKWYKKNNQWFIKELQPFYAESAFYRSTRIFGKQWYTWKKFSVFWKDSAADFRFTALWRLNCPGAFHPPGL